jgi:hypothetical protein
MGIEFVSMNQKVSKAGEVSKYIGDYVEIHGYADTDEYGNVVLASAVYSQIQEKAAQNQMEAVCVYYAETDRYIYYDMQLAYNLEVPIIGFSRKHYINSLVRVVRQENGKV